MNEYIGMKGKSRRIAGVLLKDGQMLDLVVYGDGSYGILKGQTALGIWEPQQAKHLFRWLAGCEGNAEEPRVTVLLSKTRSDSATLGYLAGELAN